MNREELIAYDRWLTENKWGSSEIITPEQAADLYLAKHPLPPAEGAEQRIRVRNILQDFYRRGEYELEQAEEDIMRLFQPQPTAEGAEEIDARTYFDEWMRQHNYRSNKLIGWSETVDFADDFATLHAQRIADKMVEKKSPSNEQIHEAALAWARDHSEAPDKDCPDWLIRDYEAGAYFVRQCYGCLNKTDNLKIRER